MRPTTAVGGGEDVITGAWLIAWSVTLIVNAGGVTVPPGRPSDTCTCTELLPNCAAVGRQVTSPVVPSMVMPTGFTGRLYVKGSLS